MLVLFASLNLVNAVKRELARRGVFAEMLRTPQSLASTGCGFALRCALDQVDLVLGAAAEAHVEAGGVFDEPAGADRRFLASPSGSDEEA
jgi:hypothetical protein